MAESTICVVGFGSDDIPRRELRNLLRWFPGYEGCNISEPREAPRKELALYAKFVDKIHAQGAAETLSGLPFDVDNPQDYMRADLAKKELNLKEVNSRAGREDNNGKGDDNDPMDGANPFEDQIAPAEGLRSSAPSSLVADNAALNALVGNLGLASQQLGALNSLAGLAGLGGGLNQLAALGMVGPVASAGQPTAPPQTLPPLTPTSGAPVSGSGQAFKEKAESQGGPIETIAILGMSEKNITEEYLRREFSQLPGFSTMKVNPRMGAAFAKFESRAHAEAAMLASNALGLGAEWARRNLC